MPFITQSFLKSVHCNKLGYTFHNVQQVSNAKSIYLCNSLLSCDLNPHKLNPEETSEAHGAPLTNITGYRRGGLENDPE